MNVRKSDGSVEEFDVEKVRLSICKAYEGIGEECNDLLLDSVANNLYLYDGVTTSEIRRQVEDALMSINKKVAKEYADKYNDMLPRRKRQDFIKAYIHASNAATGSKFDANANVTMKNIVTLGHELYKEDNIKQNRYILTDKIKHMYSKKLAEQYLADLESHILYKHDESGTPGYPYTYGSKEVVFVEYRGERLLVPFDLLYELVDEEEVEVDIENDVHQKIMADDSLKVLDRDNTWTKVTHLTRKKCHRDLVRVKTVFGEDVIVTDNHPMITNYENVDLDTVEAAKSEGIKQLKIGEKINFKDINVYDLADSGVGEVHDKYIVLNYGSPVKRFIELNRDFGYLVGFFVGDGNYNNAADNASIVFTQKDRRVLEHLNDILFDTFGITGKIAFKRDLTRCYSLRSSNDALWYMLSQYFLIQDKAWNKTLPINIYDLNEEFAKGVLEGLIDSDGTVNKNQLSIRLSSRSAILQTTSLLRYFGYSVGNTTQSLGFSNNKSYTTNYTIFGVNCGYNEDCVPLDRSFKFKKLGMTRVTPKYKLSGETTIHSVTKLEESSFLDLNQYIYDITTETHSLACNNLLMHNCVAITMYPFLENGLRGLGGESIAPTDFKSFCGEFINLVYTVASQFMGAVATSEVLLVADYYLRKDYGDDYYLRIDEIVDLSRKKRTIGQVIDNGFQQIVHSMNCPCGARGSQTVFWNCSYFDRPYFEGVFGNFRFPDGTKPQWVSLSFLQKRFMKWFNKERTKYTFTFPVETMALLTDGADGFIDEEYADFTAEMWSEGHSFFCYLSDSPDSLSSCCFDENQKVLWKSSTKGVSLTTLKELHDTKWEPDKKNLRIFHNGSWVYGKSVKLPNRKMYKVVTMNNKVFNMTDNHINVTIDGEKRTDQLTISDYLLFNTLPLNRVPESDEHLTYEEGFVVGMFIGDGSFGTRDNDGIPYDINFSLNKEKYEKTASIINEANKQLGGTHKTTLGNDYNNVYPLRLSSKEMIKFIIKWTNWTEGTHAPNKELNLDCLLQSIEFRKGILDGWYATDGGNSNRCYTTSPKLAECMEVLITSLGLQSIIDISDRTSEKVIVRDEEYNRNYPLYCVRWYEQANHRSNKDSEKSWIKKNNSLYFKVKSIEEIEYDGDVYCIECRNEDEPYFTLPSGLITHNCRLRNSLKDNEDVEHNHTTHQYSMGTASVATGSKSVMTINLPRLVQNACRRYFEDEYGFTLEPGQNIPELGLDYDKDKLYEYIRDDVRAMTERVHKYQTAFNETIKDFLNADMLDVYRAGFIDMRKQYLTVGVNGITDAAEFIGIKVGVNDDYKEFVNNILETINISNRKDKTRECMFNTEFVPAENLAAKNYKWDKKDGYWVSPNRNMYSSYFYNPEDATLSVIDKMKLHGRDYVKYLDGGSACHENLAEHLTKEQYRHLLSIAAKNGCNYFTFNVRNTVCNDCGYISKDTLDKCPKCGSENLDYLTRVIGYLKRISSFSEARQHEAEKRVYATLD